MEVTYRTSLRRINDCWLTSDLLFQLSLHLTILRGSSMAWSWRRMRPRMRGTRQTEITLLRVETPTRAKSKACLCCVRLHSSWEILNVSHAFFRVKNKWMNKMAKEWHLWTTVIMNTRCHNFSDTHLHLWAELDPLLLLAVQSPFQFFNLTEDRGRVQLDSELRHFFFQVQTIFTHVHVHTHIQSHNQSVVRIGFDMWRQEK